MSPIPYAHVTTTTTHKTLRGPRGGMILCSNEVNEKFNFNKAVFPGIQGGPLMHVIAAKAVCFKEALDDSYKVYMGNVKKNAAALAQGLIKRGFTLVSGGTDNHLMLVDLRNMNITGKQCEKLLDAANITCNKNTIPKDPASPEDMDKIAEAIAMLVKDVDANKEAAMKIVKELTDKYPIY